MSKSASNTSIGIGRRACRTLIWTIPLVLVLALAYYEVQRWMWERDQQQLEALELDRLHWQVLSLTRRTHAAELRKQEYEKELAQLNQGGKTTEKSEKERALKALAEEIRVNRAAIKRLEAEIERRQTK